MSLGRWIGAVVAASALVLALAGVAGAADPPAAGVLPVPPLTSRVTDLTGTLSAAERQALEAKLAAWEARTTNQLVVVIVPSTEPEPIEQYSLRIAEAWKIGQKGKDNGAIFLIAKDDRRMRIEVAYGFEGVLTDVTARRIIGETVAPYFKQGQFAQGINAGVDRIIEVVGTGEPLPVETTGGRPTRHSFDFGNLFIILLVAVPIVGTILRSMFGNVGGSIIGGGLAGTIAWFVAGSLLIAAGAGVVAFVIIIFSMFSGGRGGGWYPGGGGGGFGGGGGGGGGFSGGGGSFGGGGASGSW
jgi:uncharacterized protein